MTWKQTVNSFQFYAETTPSSVVGVSSEFYLEWTFGVDASCIGWKSAHPALNLTLTIAWSLINLDHSSRYKCSSRNCLRRNSTQFATQSYVSPFFGVEIFRVDKRSSFLVPSFDSSFGMTALELILRLLGSHNYCGSHQRSLSHIFVVFISNLCQKLNHLQLLLEEYG